MSLVNQKQQKPSTLVQRQSDTFIRPSDGQIVQMNQENALTEVSSSNFQPVIQRNQFGEPNFFQPQNTVQTRLKTGQENHSGEKESAPNHDKGLPKGLQSGLEQLSGEDLSGVQVHRNSSKPDAINAHAYAQGNDIHLGPGQEKHLPHEAWHVVQQRQGRVQPNIQLKDKQINNDSGLEKEADMMGAKAANMSTKETPSVQAKRNRFSSRNNVIQRAMKFEYQLFRNNLYRDTGSIVHPLPRKYGPRDYVMRSWSGARLESETNGQIEFETSWEKKWSKLGKQVNAIHNIAETMNDKSQSPEVKGSDGKTYRKFPFNWATKHLRSHKGFATSGKTWKRHQKDGKVEINAKEKDSAYFRSSTSYKSGNNIIESIKNGKKVFVHYYSDNGKWARIQYNGNWGWVWHQSLTEMENKKYESHSKDTLLGENEKILFKEGDTKWMAKVQVSESFGLEQFQSYLNQHDQKWAPNLTSKLSKLLLSQKQETPSSNETILKKIRENWDFIEKYNSLKNFLLMIGYYIEQAHHQSTREWELHGKDNEGKKIYKQTGNPGTAKSAFTLMSRTHFGAIFNSLNPEEKTIFRHLVADKENGILPTLKVKEGRNFFKDGTTYDFNPTVEEWLVSITKGADILSYQSENKDKLPASMGRFNIDKKGKHKDLIRFEGRELKGQKVPLTEWITYVKDQFVAAAALRARKTGKGETGLEL